MTSAPDLRPPVVPAPRPSSGPVPGVPRDRRPERVVAGLVLLGVGSSWLLDELGVSVPWALAPAAGVIVLGLALMVTARSRASHAGLVAWGAILLAVALVLAVAQPRGPVGDRLVTPAASDWPVATSLSAGNLTLDLRSNPLPASGRLDADVGAGKVVVLVPRGVTVQVVAHIGMGEVFVDGVQARGGMGIDWSDPAAPVVVDVNVNMGQVEVRHG